jgi:hypothetical protein
MQNELPNPLDALVSLVVKLLPRFVVACRDSPRDEALQLMTDLWAALEETYVQNSLK